MSALRAIPCTIMRGGTSKGLYFRLSDLPADVELRDRILLSAMGSPDLRQIDGLGGADPLTSKVAVVSPSARPDADVDYLFLQVVVDEPRVDPSQNCGNILAGVGPFAIEQGWVHPSGDVTQVRIHMVNTKSLAVASIRTPGGRVQYDGEARIDGVPGTAAPILLDFLDIAGSSCGALLPTGNARDLVDGVTVTCIDNGMPVVLIRAADLGRSGNETVAELETNAELKARIERIRLAAGPLMNSAMWRRRRCRKCAWSPHRNTAALFRRVPSFRIACTSRLACWARSALPPPASCPDRWPPIWLGPALEVASAVSISSTRPVFSRFRSRSSSWAVCRP